MADTSDVDVLEPDLMNLVELDTLKWIFVGGKGGVGKTTCSCSLGLQLAKYREKVLIVSTDPAHNLSDAFRQKFTDAPLLVEGMRNLYAMELDPVPPVDKDQLEEMLARDNAGGGLSSLFGGTDFLKTLPDIQEVVSLANVFKKVKGMGFSVVVFDTAPTGHTLRLLSMPPEVERGLGSLMALKDNFAGMLGPLSTAFGLPTITSDAISSKLADVLPALQELTIEFKNPDRTTFVCVCIPEMLSLYETERLIQDLTRMDVDVQNIIVNRLLPPASGEGSCKMCDARLRIQKKYVGQIDDMYKDFHICKLPLLKNEVRGLEQLRSFSENLIRPSGLSATSADSGPRGDCATAAEAHAAAPPPLESCVDDLEPTLRNVVEQSTLKWVFVGGKGGVGKTTCGSALAAQLSRVREKVLLVSTDPAHNLSDVFDQELGEEPRLVNGFRNLFAMELDLAPVAEDQEELIAEGNMGGGIGELMSDFVKSFPGITEVMALAGLIRMIQVAEFSVVVFDTAPTGHTLRLLSIPLAMEETLGKVMSAGPFAGLLSMLGSSFGVGDHSPDDIQSGFGDILPALQDLNRQFQDPAKTTFVCVCISEFLSLFETERLVQELTRYKIDTHNIVVNQLLFPLDGLVTCTMCNARRRIQRKYLDEICDLYEDYHITKLPLLAQEVRGAGGLLDFSRRLLTPCDPSSPSF